MIRGMSYPKGIFYMDKDYISHATLDHNGEVQTQLFPFDVTGLLFFLKRTLFTIPWYFAMGIFLLSGWVWMQPGFPFYVLLLAGFGYHFMFPYPLKQYHGAEHKVFSHQGTKTILSLEDIKRCDIVNRHCSTNGVVIFYALFALAYWPLGGNAASLAALVGVWVIPRWLKPLDRKLFFPISAYCQRHITTIEPDMKHLKVALLSYLSLIKKMAVTEKMLLEEIHAEEEKKRERLKKEERERVILETEWQEI